MTSAGQATEHSDRLPLPRARLVSVAQAILDAARRGGATAAEAEVSQAIGQSVTVRRADHCRVYIAAVRGNPLPAGAAGDGWTRYGIRSIVGFDRLTPPEKAAAIERFFPDLWSRIAPPAQ